MLSRNVSNIDAYTTLELENDFCGKRKFQRSEYPISKTRLPDKEIMVGRPWVSDRSFLAIGTDYQFNTSPGGYIFFLDLAIYSTLAYVDDYLLISLALFFLAANFGRRKLPDHGVQQKWPLAQCVLGIRPK